MRKIFSMPVRAQLFLMACFVALPALGILIYSGLDHRRAAMNEARTETRKLADSIASQQQALVAASEQLVSALAQLPDIRNHDTARVQALLSDILKLNPQYLNIFIADRTGTMWASAVPMKNQFPVADRRYFAKARASGRFSSGEYIIGRIFGKPTLSFGYPIRNRRGEFDGVIAVNVNLAYNRELLTQAKLPPGSGYLLIDHRGTILSSGRVPSQYVGQRDHREIFQRTEQEPDGGTFVDVGFDGTRRIMTCRKLHLTGEQTPYMYIRATIPVDVAVENANAALVRNLVLFSPFFLFAFFIAWLIGKRSIVDRVAMLQAASQRLASGDLQTRVADLVTGGELGRLAQSFDGMARDIAAHDKALRDSEEHYRLLIENSPNMVMIHCDGKITFINAAGMRMLGATQAGQIVGRPVLDFVHADYHGLVANRWQLIDAGVQVLPRIEEKYLRLDGSVFDVDVAAIPLTLAGERAVEVIVRDISERKQAEEKIRGALAEKVVLLQEIHHRTKNSLQIITGLLDLQAQALGDPHCREIFAASQNRISALALIYDRLYETHNLTSIDLHGYVKSLCCDLLATCRGEPGDVRFGFHFAAEPMNIDIDTAIPCGLIVNELVSNALRHAFGKNTEGNAIDIGLCRNEAGSITLTIADNGRGLPQDRECCESNLGLRLVRILVRQLDGVMVVDTARGTEYRVTFRDASPPDAAEYDETAAPCTEGGGTGHS